MIEYIFILTFRKIIMIGAKIILIPIVGFIIGSFTNYLAIKMLFHPRKKIFGIQGLLPKRKDILAKKIGEATHKIMPPYFKKIENIPIFGNKILEAFNKSVEQQIKSLSEDELEIIIFGVMKKEMRFVIWAGGIIGFLIGCFQVLLAI
jgi:uncharacterized membrane protein YheB (UPF0754 family)